MFYECYCVGLNAFMAVLDQRLNQKQQQQPVGLVAKKVRKVEEPSQTRPPVGAPLWAIKKDLQDGMYSDSSCSCFVINQTS